MLDATRTRASRRIVTRVVARMHPTEFAAWLIGRRLRRYRRA